MAVKLPLVSAEVQDLLMWKDVKRSGTVVGAATAMWLVLGSGLLGLSLGQLLALLFVIATPFCYLMQAAGPYLGKHKCFQEMIPAVLATGVDEEAAKESAVAVVAYLNPFLRFLGRLAFGEDLTLTFSVTGAAYLALKVLGWCSIITLLYIATLLTFVLPKVYEAKQKEIDALASQAGTKLLELQRKLDELVFKKIKPHTAKVE